MSQTVQANPKALVESIARILPPGAQDDFRNLMNEVVLSNLTALSPGGNLLQTGGAQPGSSAPPQGVTFNVGGANGAFTGAITDPSTAKPNTIWHEISYSPLVSFTQNVTTLTPTTNTAFNIPAPGVSAYFRMRVSFDKQTWSAYQLASTSPIDAGLVESAAISPAGAYNQSNFGTVNSQAVGSSASVTISGTGGDLTSYPAIRGATQSNRPSATIVGVEPGSEQFVAWDGDGFQLKPTLAGVFADGLEPVGKVSVVSTTAPTLPTIIPVIVGGFIIGYGITSGGAGASQPYTLTIAGAGAGAVPGPQTIVAGVLTAIAPGNPGTGGYLPGTTVTASGGGGGGASGGGTAAGGNGGRLSNV